MDSFTLKQSRYSVTDAATAALSFRIDITCEVIRDTSSQVELTPDVFVYRTTDTSEADVSSGGSIDASFSRVATVADLGLLPISREDALALGAAEYRTRSLQLSMPDLETATNAIPVIVDRVNSLVDTHIKYQRDFYSGIDVEYDLPLASDPSVVEKYSTAYSNSVEARKSAEQSLEESQRAHSQLEARNEILRSYVSELDRCLAALGPVVTSLQGANSDIAADSSLSSSLRQQVGTSTFSLVSFSNLLTAVRDNRASLLSSGEASSSLLLSDLKESHDSLESLELTESAALDDLRVYCPQVNPDSIIA